MAEKNKKDKDEQDAPAAGSGEKGGGTATAPPKTKSKTTPKKSPPGMLPPWKVLLHNDDKNEFLYVIDTIVELTPLNKQDAEVRTVEAHNEGIALLLTTHKERAELYQEQFTSKGLVVTIEPAGK
jgi:ATP-dependent Clp protease adaptor protein ClpS